MQLINNMKKVVVIALQTWLDISIQETGNVYNAFEIALANNRSLTDDLVPGETILIPTGVIISDKELKYFEARNILPATGIYITQNDYLEYELPQEFPLSF